jgi:phospholipase C
VRARYPGDAATRSGRSRPFAVEVLPVPVGIHKIQHVVIIMQENRSFDEYFGTYPGAEGIPPGVCVPDPATGGCIAPYHDPTDLNSGGPHGSSNFEADLNGGAMNGFVAQAENAQGCTTAATPQCETDVMGYKTESDIPNYWAYARNFVLQDQMFEPNKSWSLPQHLFLLSEWSARCTLPDEPFSCTNELDDPGFQDSNPNDPLLGPQPDYAWTDMTYLLHRAGVSWRYYIKQGIQPDCADGEMRCANAPRQGPATPGIWNPLPNFTTVREDRQLGNIQDTSAFLLAARSGTLPAVSWVIPSQPVSEHPTAAVSTGQAYVTNLINAVMRGPDWPSTAIFLSWDDWGGFYDNVVPPVIDGNGYGFRVPGLVISPYAKQGYIDHQLLSHDAYNKFIEDDFLASQRLNPATDGRPDPRPTVREAVPQLGDLVNDFEFHQAPRAPLILTP